MKIVGYPANLQPISSEVLGRSHHFLSGFSLTHSVEHEQDDGCLAPGKQVPSQERMNKRSKQSASLLMFRQAGNSHEVFLVHPGGPYWVKKNEGSWTLPKGEYAADEEPLGAAQREFEEETGLLPHGPFLELDSVRQKSGKVVLAWAFEGDCDPARLVSNTCEVEWPPRSQKCIVIPEIDRGAWFSPAQAALFIREEQKPLLLRLEQQLRDRSR